MIHFLHTYIPSAVAFSAGPFTIYWYSIIAVVGLIVSWAVISSVARFYDVQTDFFNLFFGIIITALIGARLYHVFNEFHFYASSPFLIFQVWRGGLAFHGGLLGGSLFVLYWVYKHNKSFFRVADIMAPGVILFQAIGRWGNYFNQELFGTPTDLPWGIPILQMNRPIGFLDSLYFHPTFLYESFLNTIVFFILIALHRGMSRGTLSLRDGTIFFVYIVLYSVIRFFLEFIRIDATPEFFGIRLPQLVSVLLIFIAIVFFVKHYINGRHTISEV